MHKRFESMAAAFLVALGSIAGFARADWPARVFAPYAYGNGTALTDAFNATGQKYFTLAFATSNRQTFQPSFGAGPLSARNFGSQIDAIRAKGGDVIMSFGGGGGFEPAMGETDPVKLQALYQEMIDAYKLTWLDIDAEGGSLEKTDVNHRRNTALMGLQKANPGLIVAYTLPADPDGLTKFGIALLQDAKDQGLKVEVVNAMTMDYGQNFLPGHNMGDLAIATATKTYEQTQAIDPAMKLGITPDIGINDEKNETFGLDDARMVMNWVKDKPYVRLIAFWVLQRDHAHGDYNRDSASGVTQKDWEFNNIFNTFTVGFVPATKPATRP